MEKQQLDYFKILQGSEDAKDEGIKKGLTGQDIEILKDNFMILQISETAKI